MDIRLIRHDGRAFQEADNDWRGDVIEAIVDGQPAGYIQMHYIPAEVVRERHPDAWEAVERYAASTSGMSVDEWHLSNRSVAASPEVRADQAFRAFRDMCQSVRPLHLGWPPAKAIDKPVVSMIKLYRPIAPDNKIKSWPDGKVRLVGPDRNYQGLGLGMLLYREGARWMAERGMTLHEDVMKSAKAQATWARLRAECPDAFKVETFWEAWAEDPDEDVKRILVMDGSGFPPWVPRNTTSLSIEDGAASVPAEEATMEFGAR